MSSNTKNTTINPDHLVEESPLARRLRRIGRVLLPFISLTVSIQPIAFAAPTPSLLSQRPRFVDVSVEPNVVFMMDDSQSMMQMVLPTPSGIVPSTTGSTTFTLNRANPITAATTATETRADWVRRSATLNPNYYNPAIRYLPWNNNGTLRPNSDTSMTPDTDGWREGRTQHDARFAGPNYTTSANLGPIAPDRYGANSLVERADGTNDNFFSGANNGTEQQDIFSRPMVRTGTSTSTTTVCNAYNTGYIYVNFGYNTTTTTSCSGTLTPRTEQWRGENGCTGSYGAYVTTTTAPATYLCAAATETGSRSSLTPQRQFTCLTGTTTVSGMCCPSFQVVTTTTVTNPGVNTLCSGTTGPLACPCTSSTTTTGSPTVTSCPAGQICPASNRWVTEPQKRVIARYFRYEGADADAAKANTANYKLVEIERYDNDNADPATTLIPSSQLFPVYRENGTAVVTTDPGIRLDCTASVGSTKACTWVQEAQNFANWYTYYRTRLFSAIAVTAEALSGLTALNTLDSLRLGYGSINYFDKSGNPYSVSDPWTLNLSTVTTRAVTDVDPLGQGGYAARPQDSSGFVSNAGAIVRGIRSFQQGSPERQQVFNWLFSLRTIGATPNREALDSIGRYFSRKDAWGPWSDTPGAVPSFDSQPVTDHASCRRNYAILVTDGEWTKQSTVDPLKPAQPLLEDSARAATLPVWVTSQSPATPLDARSVAGPTINDGVGPAASPPTDPEFKTFPPLAGFPGYGQPQFSTVATNPTGTLTDVAYYWWSRDLRPDLQNSVRPLVPPHETVPERRNEAYWQHLTPFIVGYGLDASMDDAGTRLAIANRTAVSWPAVNTTSGVIVDPGRIDDTYRAARAARGDFLVATDVTKLASSIAAAFSRIGETAGAATAITGRSASLETNDRLYSASFVTNRWAGKVEAFDALALNRAFQDGTAPPAAIATSNFPAAATRSIFTSTDIVNSGTSFRWATLAPAQQTALGSAAVLDYLRGVQLAEVQNGGTFRNRNSGEIMGDIVNSNPIYSKATDARYNGFRRPEASYTNPAVRTTSQASLYPAFVDDNRTSRPAAVYAGSNSGMLHAFNASDLSERFAYVPRAVYSALPNLAVPTYVHRYFVDGPVVEGDVYIGGAWRTVVIGTTGAGPKGVFALDVTQRTGATARGFAASDVLWDIAGTDSSLTNIAELGHITQPGVIGSGKDGEWYYFTGNGWESGNDKARLLAIRIRDGAILSIATDAAGGPNPADASIANRPNGLGGVSPMYDSHRNIVGIYAGDRLGRLWKFDLSSTNPASWAVATGAPLFIAEDSSGNRQPITAAPRVMAHPLGGRLIGIGTGRLTENADTGDASVQSIYAIWERNPTAPVAVSRASLRPFTFSETGTAVNRDRLRALNGIAALNWATDKGWRVDLLVGTGALGERVVAAPIEANGFLNVTSFEPIAGGNVCQGGGASFFYRFDVAGSFTNCGLRAPGAGGVCRGLNVVGTETLAAVGGLRIAGEATPTTAANLATLDKANLKAMLTTPKRSTATDSCRTQSALGRSDRNAATGTTLAPCPSQAQRVWRELPRGPR